MIEPKASFGQRSVHRIASIALRGGRAGGTIWKIWSEIAGYMVLLWLLVVASTTEGYFPVVNEFFHLDVAQKFWPVFKLSWPVAVASAIVFSAMLLGWKATSGEKLGHRMIAAAFIGGGGLALASVFLLLAIPILWLLGQDISGLKAKPCPFLLSYSFLAQSCIADLGEGGRGYWIADFIASFARFYGRTNFILAIGLGVFATHLVSRLAMIRGPDGE